MEKEKEVCVLSKCRFDIYWKLLLLNYNLKNTHIIQQKYKLYYSFFKNFEEEDFKIAIERAIKCQQYFPNINEIYKYLPSEEEKTERKMKEWEGIKKEETSEEELKELQEMFKNFK